MREPIDNWWQQQLQGYTATPHPADWESVYSRLHGRRRNRRIWLMLPLLLAMAVGGTLAYRHYFSGNNNNITAGKSIASPKPDTHKNSGLASTDIPDAAATENSPPHKAKQQQRQPIEKAAPQKVAATTAVLQYSGVNAAPTTTQIPIPVGNKTSANGDPTTSLTGNKINGTAAGSTMMPMPENPSTANDLAAQTYDTPPLAPEQTTYRLTLLSTEATQQAKDIPANKPVPAFTSLSPTLPNSLVGKKMPTRSLQWWPYVSLGITTAASNAPFDMRKSFEISNDLNSGTGGSSRLVYASVGTLTGMHAGAGVLLQKPLGKRIDLRTGLGMAYSTWQEEGNIFRDSTLVGGTAATRQTLGTYAFGYQYLSAQVPVLLSGRIGPAGNLQWGWTAGLQNNFTLGLTEERNTSAILSTGTGNFFTQEQKDAITTKTKLWQASLQLGFYLRHQKKSEWQLEPRLSLPLSAMYKNNANLQQVYPTNFALQWSWRLQ